MNEWFVEVLDKDDQWVKFDDKVFPSWADASNHAYRLGLRDETDYFRIKVQWNDRYTYYGPCH